MSKERIQYRLRKMANTGLIRKTEHQEYGQGVNPTYHWRAVPSKIEQYEDEHSRLVTPSWKWQEYADKYFDAFESRLKQLEKQVQDG